MYTNTFHTQFLMVALLILPFCFLKAQVSINESNTDPAPSAMLDVQSSNKGILMPRMNSDERDAISNPAPGLMIYNIDDSCFNYFSGQEWVKDCGRELEADQIPVSPQTYGGTGKDEGHGIAADRDGNIYVTGSFEGTVSFGDTTLTTQGSHEDVFLAKYDPEGHLIWIAHGKGTSRDISYAVAVDDFGNSFITGEFDGSLSFGSTSFTAAGSNSAIFTAKFDPSGHFLWLEQIPSTGGFGRGISVDAMGNCYIVAQSGGSLVFGTTPITPPSSGQDILIAKYGPNGQALWISFGEGDMLFDPDFEISTDDVGNSYISGAYRFSISFGGPTISSLHPESNALVAKFDPAGQLLWLDSPLGVGEGNGVSQDALGNAYVVGSFSGSSMAIGGITLNNSGGPTMYIAKYDPNGQVLWAKTNSGNGQVRLAKITTDSEGNSYVTGMFSGSISFDSHTLSSTTVGHMDVFVVKYDSDGQALWAVKGGGTSADHGYDICLGTDNACYVTGSYRSSSIFHDMTFNSNGLEDMFIWAIDGSTGGKGSVHVNNLSNSQDEDSDPNNELQTLSLIGTQLSIENGNSIDLSLPQDNLGNHTADTNLNLNGHFLSGDGDNEGIFVNANGRVGILTASPKASLDVIGEAMITANSPRMTFYREGSTQLGGSIARSSFIQAILDGNELNPPIATPADQRLDFHVSNNVGTNTSRVMSLRGDGRVGIGTPSAESMLHLYASNEGDVSGIKLSGNNGSVNSMIYQEDSDLILRKQNMTDQLVLDAGGNIGIGTNSPSTELHISQTGSRAGLAVERTDGSFMELLSGTGLSGIGFDNTKTFSIGPISAIGNNPTSATSLTIDNAGNVGIGNSIVFPDGSVQTTAPAETGVYTVGGHNFSNRNGVGARFGQANGFGGGHFQSGSDPLIAPILLPQGATITKVSFYGVDLHTTNIQMSVKRRALQSSIASTLASHTSNTVSGLYSGTDTSISNAVIDNSQYLYYVNVELIGGGWHSQGELAVNAVVIEYDLP